MWRTGRKWIGTMAEFSGNEKRRRGRISSIEEKKRRRRNKEKEKKRKKSIREVGREVGGRNEGK